MWCDVGAEWANTEYWPSSFFFGYVNRYFPWVGDNGPKLKREPGGVGEVGWLHATVAVPAAFAIDAGIVPIGRQ